MAYRLRYLVAVPCVGRKNYCRKGIICPSKIDDAITIAVFTIAREYFWIRLIFALL